MIPLRETKSGDTAVSNLTDMFRNKTTIATFAKIFGDRWQLVEDAIWSVYDGVLNPSGKMLDYLGSIVNLSRNGLSDSDYRGAIYVQMLVLRSNGLPDELLKIVSLFMQNNGSPGYGHTGAIVYNELAPRSIDILVLGITNPALLASFLQRARPAGRYLTLSYDSVLPGVAPSLTQPFIWGSSYGGVTSQGFGYRTFQPRYFIGSFVA